MAAVGAGFEGGETGGVPSQGTSAQAPTRPGCELGTQARRRGTRALAARPPVDRLQSRAPSPPFFSLSHLALARPAPVLGQRPGDGQEGGAAGVVAAAAGAPAAAPPGFPGREVTAGRHDERERK